MKKALAVILIFSLCLSSVFSETLKQKALGYEYEAYEKEEFPLWTNELRRGEILFFGSYVFTIPISTLVLSSLRSVDAIPSGTTEKNALLALTCATGVSLFVATLDWIIGKVQN